MMDNEYGKVIETHEFVRRLRSFDSSSLYFVESQIEALFVVAFEF